MDLLPRRHLTSKVLNQDVYAHLHILIWVFAVEGFGSWKHDVKYELGHAPKKNIWSAQFKISMCMHVHPHSLVRVFGSLQ